MDRRNFTKAGLLGLGGIVANLLPIQAKPTTRKVSELDSGLAGTEMPLNKGLESSSLPPSALKNPCKEFGPHIISSFNNIGDYFEKCINGDEQSCKDIAKAFEEVFNIEISKKFNCVHPLEQYYKQYDFKQLLLCGSVSNTIISSMMFTYKHIIDRRFDIIVRTCQIAEEEILKHIAFYNKDVLYKPYPIQINALSTNFNDVEQAVMFNIELNGWNK